MKAAVVIPENLTGKILKVVTKDYGMNMGVGVAAEIYNVENTEDETIHTKVAEYSPLSIAMTDIDTYNGMLSDSVDPDVMYYISSDYLDGLKKRVINVGTPEIGSDAVNKRYFEDNALIKRDFTPVYPVLRNKLSHADNAEFVAWSEVRLADMFDIPADCIVDGKVDISKIAIPCKDVFNYTADNKVIKMEIYEDTEAIKTFPRINDFAGGVLVAASTNYCLHGIKRTMEFTFTDCKLSPSEKYIIRFVEQNDEHNYTAYGNFKFTSIDGYVFSHGKWNTDQHIVYYDRNDFLTSNFAIFIPYIEVRCEANINGIQPYSVVLNNIILRDTNLSDYYSLHIDNGVLKCDRISCLMPDNITDSSSSNTTDVEHYVEIEE